MRIYEHKQVGKLLTATLLLAAAGVCAALLASPARGQPIVWLVAAILALTVVLFTSMTVRVSDNEVRLWFGPGLIRKRFAIEDIAEVAPVRNPWWYGWGIHLTPNGWLFNVAGLDAVELRLRNDRKVRIGTDEPTRLVAAIRQAMERKR